MITVSNNKRYLEKNGKHYPYLADTAWTLLQRLTREEIKYYLDFREKQGFNAIQVSAISELDGLNIPNQEGHLPFINQNVYQPNEKYFDMLLFLIDECEKRNMALTLLPTWGDKFNKKWGIGPEIFTQSNSKYYGEYLANLIGKHEDIIFMLGGDRPIENAVHRKIIDAMAQGLKNGEVVRHLITYHPNGESSSLDFLKNCDYLDFHSLQSGHSFRGYFSDKMIKQVLENEDKPCLDAESFYEDFPIDFNLEFGYRFDSNDIRNRIYSNLIAGSLGTVYGHQSVWCFREDKDDEYLFDWKTALNRPMANEIKNINIFLNDISVLDMRPFTECYNAKAIANSKNIVVLALDKNPFFIKMGDKILKSARWFDTVNGHFTEAEISKSNNITIISPFNYAALLVMDLV